MDTRFDDIFLRQKITNYKLSVVATKDGKARRKCGCICDITKYKTTTTIKDLIHGQSGKYVSRASAFNFGKNTLTLVKIEIGWDRKKC